MITARIVFGEPNRAFPLADVLNSVLDGRHVPPVMRLGFPFVSYAGVEALLDGLRDRDLWMRSPKLWLVGIHQGITEPAALRRIGAFPFSDVRVISGTGDISARALRARPMFHAKLIAVERQVPVSQSAPLEALIVSSANLTRAAIGKGRANYEAGAVLHDVDDVTSAAWTRWWRVAWNAGTNLTDDVVERYAKVRDGFIRANPIILEIADPPSVANLKNATTLWIDGGAMSGGSRNQVEFNRELAAFFGPVLKRQRMLSVEIGKAKWDDRPLSPKVTTFGVEIWRLSLPTETSGGYQYPGKVIRFRRRAALSNAFVVDIAEANSRPALAWRSQANREGYLGTTSGNRAFGFF